MQGKLREGELSGLGLGVRESLGRNKDEVGWVRTGGGGMGEGDGYQVAAGCCTGRRKSKVGVKAGF